MANRRRYRRPARGGGSPWWISGVYAIALGFGLVMILLFTGNGGTGSLGALFFPSSESAESDPAEPSEERPIGDPEIAVDDDATSHEVDADSESNSSRGDATRNEP